MTLTAAVGPSVYWYLTRGSGAVALVLLTASVVLGITGTLRLSSRAWPRFAIDTVHRDVSLLVIVFLLVHIVTSVLDSFAPIALTDAIIPFGGTYRPLWLGLGALSFDLVLALAITSLVRRRLGYGTWRAIHWLAYASWPVAVLHGLGTGSDSKVAWMLLATAVCVAAVVAATGLRFARGEGVGERVRAAGLALTVAAPIGIAVFTLAGPLQHGWARTAGTPAKLLAHATPVAAPAPSASAAPARTAGGPPQPFDASVSGSVTQRSVAGGGLVDLDLALGGGTRGRLRVRLAGSPMDGGGLSMTGSQVDLLLSGSATRVLAGTISSLQGSDFLAHVRDAAGSLTLTVHLDIDQQTGQVSGEVRGSV